MFGENIWRSGSTHREKDRDIEYYMNKLIYNSFSTKNSNRSYIPPKNWMMINWLSYPCTAGILFLLNSLLYKKVTYPTGSYSSCNKDDCIHFKNSIKCNIKALYNIIASFVSSSKEWSMEKEALIRHIFIFIHDIFLRGGERFLI